MNRKKFIITTITTTGVAVSGKFLFAKPKAVKLSKYTSNPSLKTINPDWQGNPLDQNGKFMNHEFPLIQDFGSVFKWMTQRNPQKEFKKNDTWRIPVIKNDTFVSDNSDKVVWLGHASFYIQLNGIRILIDPIFGKLQVGKRYSELPISPKKFINIDYILVSHAHYDHCDKNSIKLLTKQNPSAEILTGLNQDKLLSGWTSNKIQTAGWYQQYNLLNNFEVTYLPSRHWANRSLWDINETLWGGFMIKLGEKTIYFGGDSGYGSHFKDIGQIFPNIDLALIGAGAYSPAWFMGANHQDPYDAVKAFADTGAKTFVPFHYGTFDAADEPLGEPEEILTKLNSEGKIKNELRVLKLGEAFGI